LEIAQPLLVVVGELAAGPVDRFFGERVEALELLGYGSLLVVVAFHHGALKIADDLETLVRVGVVTDDITKTHVVGYLVLLGVGDLGTLGVELGGFAVILEFHSVKEAQMIVEGGVVGVIGDTPDEVILADFPVFVPRFDAQSLAWLFLVLHRGYASVESHVPG